MVGHGWVFDCFPYYGKPRVEEDKEASPECNYYQKWRVSDGQQAPNMNATGKWAKWV